MVVDAAVLPQRGHDRRAEARPQVAHEVRHARGTRHLVRAQARQVDRDQRQEEAADAHAHRQPRQRHAPVIDVGREGGAPERDRGKDQEAEGRDRARVHAVHVGADDRPHDHREHAAEGHRLAGPQRRVALVALQPQRQHDHGAEEGDRTQHQAQHAEREIAALEQPQIHDRVRIVPLPDHEIQQRGARDAGQRDHGRRAEPVELVALVEQDLQRADADHQQGQADIVDRLLAPWRLAPGQQLPGEQADQHAHRQVDQEDPVPGEVLGQPAAGQRPGDRRDHGRHRPQPHRQAALGRRIDRGDQRLRQRNHRGAEHPLQDARGQQHRKVRRDAAQHRGQREQQRAGREHAHLAEAPGQPAGQRQHDGLGHGIGRDDPGALGRADAEVARDRRHRDVGDRQVEDVHERGQPERDRRQDQLAPRQGLRCGLHGAFSGWRESRARSGHRPRPPGWHRPRSGTPDPGAACRPASRPRRGWYRPSRASTGRGAADAA